MKVGEFIRLQDALREEWDGTTSSIAWWNKRNPERGQCVPTSLIIQDYLGGDIERSLVTGDLLKPETHYYNRLDDGTRVDLTAVQYRPYASVKFSPSPVSLRREGFNSMRERLLSNENTAERYEILRRKVANHLATRALG